MRESGNPLEIGRAVSREMKAVANVSRVKLCIFSLVVVLCFLMIPIVTKGDTDDFYFYGGLVGIISTAIVISFMSMRDGPSKSLLLFRAVCNFATSLRFVVSHYDNKESTQSCYASCGTLQFFATASEMWFLCLAYDLIQAVKNPFSSHEKRIVKYHIVCWSVSAFFTIMNTTVDDGLDCRWHDDYVEDDVCWIHRRFTNSHRYHFAVYIPLFVVIVSVIYVMFEVYRHLANGMARNFRSRAEMLLWNLVNLGIYILYWLISSVLFAVAIRLEVRDRQAMSKEMWRLLWFFVSSRGYADLVVLICISHGYALKSVDKPSVVNYKSLLREQVLHYATTGIRESSAKRIEDSKTNVIALHMSPKDARVPIFTALGQVLFNGTLPAFIEGSLNPGKRGEFDTETSEVLLDEDSRLSDRLSSLFTPWYTKEVPEDFDCPDDDVADHVRLSRTSAVSSSTVARKSLNSASLSNNCTSTTLSNGESVSFAKSGMSQRTPEDGTVEFIEVEPYYFRQIRLQDNVKDEEYIQSFKSTIKEQVTAGGNSGAFFFFSKDQQFIAKSCTVEEFTHICESASKMAEYWKKNPSSFITKIYGAYKLGIFGNPFTFFVTNNIFLNSDNQVINEKYDLKGSWVNRSTSRIEIGQRVTCTHCNQKFLFTGYTSMATKKMRKLSRADENVERGELIDKCPRQLLGIHEPDLTLKDNDLRYRLNLSEDIALHFVIQLRKDTEFLSSLGVMDYSMLVGVHKAEFYVDEKELRRRSDTQDDQDQDYDAERRRTVSSVGSNSSQYSLSVSRGTTTLNNSSLPRRNGRLLASRVVGPEAFYMGIVDFQQKYNFSKKMEHFFKVYILGRNPAGISCIEPVAYRKRFLSRIEELVVQNDNDLSQLSFALEVEQDKNFHEELMELEFALQDLKREYDIQVSQQLVALRNDYERKTREARTKFETRLKED